MLELKELEKYAIESGAIFTVSDTEFTLRTGERQAIIDLCVCKEDDRYKCVGGIFLHDDHAQLELVNVDKTVKTEKEIIKLIEITLSIATRLNSISEQYSEIKRLGKELTDIGIMGIKNFKRR